MPLHRTSGLIVAVLVIAAGCGKGRTPAPAPAPAEPVAKISADDLVKEYQQNELGADGKYKNKFIEVKGKVGKVGRHPLGYPFLQLGSSSEEDLFGVTCYLSQQATDDAGKLKPGDEVTVRGTVMGKLGGAALRMENCELVKPATAKP